MKDLDKSLMLLNAFFEKTPKKEIRRMIERINAIFTSDISFAEYFSLMNSAYDFPAFSVTNEYKTTSFQCISDIANEKCIIGADISPVQLESDLSYTRECYYNLAA